MQKYLVILNNKTNPKIDMALFHAASNQLANYIFSRSENIQSTDYVSLIINNGVLKLKTSNIKLAYHFAEIYHTNFQTIPPQHVIDHHQI